MPGSFSSKPSLSLYNSFVWNQMLMESLVQSGSWTGLMRNAINQENLQGASSDGLNSFSLNSTLRSTARMYLRSSETLYDAASILKTAADPLLEMGKLMERMGDLAAQYVNSKTGAGARESIAAEYGKIGQTVSDMIKNTMFKNITVFDGSDRSREGLRSNQGLTIAKGARNFELKLNDFSEYLGFLQDPKNVESLNSLDKIREMVKSMRLYHSSYVRRMEMFESGAQGYGAAAGFINAAADNRSGAWENMSPESIMLSLLNRNTGLVASKIA